MGADFIGAVMMIEQARKPDWRAGREAIDKLAATPAPNWPEAYRDQWEDGDPGDELRLADELREDLDEVETCWEEGGRECGGLTLMGYNVLVTGGMSWGDSPTELTDQISRLDCADVLQACGFNRRAARDEAAIGSNELTGVLREFVEDVRLAYGAGDGAGIDEDALDWPDLAVTYRKAVAVLDRVPRPETKPGTTTAG